MEEFLRCMESLLFQNWSQDFYRPTNLPSMNIVTFNQHTIDLNLVKNLRYKIKETLLYQLPR